MVVANEEEGLINRTEVARRLGVSVRFVELLDQRGELAAVRLGVGARGVRYRPNDVRALIERKTMPWAAVQK